MSYRNISVNGIGYEYVVGRTHVKIKGVGVFLKSRVGESLGDRTFIVTPKTVERLVLGRLDPEPALCQVHDVLCDGLAVNPYQSEVRGRTVYMLNCRQCITNSRDAI